MPKVIFNPKFLFPIFVASTLVACSKDAPKPTQTPTQTKPKNHDTKPPPAAKIELTLEQKGKKLYARCRACHTLNEGGKNKVGPNLWQIFGRKAGTTEGFAYSKAMLASEIIWTADTMGSYLENPRVFMPKNKMAFAGLRKQTDRDAIIKYLQENTE